MIMEQQIHPDKTMLLKDFIMMGGTMRNGMVVYNSELISSYEYLTSGRLLPLKLDKATSDIFNEDNKGYIPLDVNKIGNDHRCVWRVSTNYRNIEELIGTTCFIRYKGDYFKPSDGWREISIGAITMKTIMFKDKSKVDHPIKIEKLGDVEFCTAVPLEELTYEERKQDAVYGFLTRTEDGENRHGLKAHDTYIRGMAEDIVNLLDEIDEPEKEIICTD